MFQLPLTDFGTVRRPRQRLRNWDQVLWEWGTVQRVPSLHRVPSALQGVHAAYENAFCAPQGLSFAVPLHNN